MVLGWRGVFCTSISKDEELEFSTMKDKPETIQSPRFSSRFGAFFSNPSTPSLRCRTAAKLPDGPPLTAGLTTNSAPQSPRLKCKTRNSTRFFTRSNPSSPRETSTFSLLKSSLRLSKSRCGICVQSVKKGEGTAIFTAECGHSFHFPCIASKIEEQGSLTCPICNSTWNEIHLLNKKSSETIAKDSNNSMNNEKRCNLKVYNDDEPLSSPTSGARFNPILESDETEEENEEFPRAFVTHNVMKTRNVEISLSSEAAVVSVTRTSETHAVVLNIKAPPAAAAHRAPIDLVTVVDVSRSLTGEKLHLMKMMMRLVVSSLSGNDRLSIVAFSAASKRLLPLRRMNTAGRRAARRIIDAIVAINGAATCAADSLKKAAKVIDDRREKNPATCILLFSDCHRGDPIISSTHREIPVHLFSLSACVNTPPDDTFAKRINDILSVVIQDLKIQLRPEPSSDPVEITAVYSPKGRPAWIGSGSSWARVGDFHSEEEREFLLELKVPSSFTGTHRVLSIRCSYRDPSTRQPVYNKERPFRIPHPRAFRSSTRDNQRLKCLFVTTRAIAESRRLVERNDLASAHYMLASARALVLRSGEEFVHQVEAELSQLNWKKQADGAPRGRNSHEREAFRLDEKVEPLTPMSAWRAAERLAKLATMRKSLNRVSDLHGFEMARF